MPTKFNRFTNTIIPSHKLMKILKIAILKDAFDEILSGEKTEEYQDFIPFWEEQLLIKDKEAVRFREYDAVEFRNGFEENVPMILVEWKGTELELFDEAPRGSKDPEDYYFVINLGKIIETKNC
jgi:hypothetical protein